MAPPAIGPLLESDLPAVAELHCVAFPDSTFTLLGPAAARAHYAWQLRPASGLTGFAARADGRLVGFCTAGLLSGSERRGLLRSHGTTLALSALRHPAAALTILLRRLSRERRPSSNIRKLFDIQAVAVHPAYRRSGVGARLLEAAEATARARGHQKMGLAVYNDSEPVARFYEHLGWQRISAGGAWLGLMTKSLP